MKAVHVHPLREFAPSGNPLAIPSGTAVAIPTTAVPERVRLRAERSPSPRVRWTDKRGTAHKGAGASRRISVTPGRPLH